MSSPQPARVDVSGLPKPDSYASLRAVWDDLDRYRLTPRGHGYPDNIQHLFAPVDAVHEAVVASATQVRVSLVGSFYGWDDAEINDLAHLKLANEHVFVALALDSTQAAGRGEVPLLKQWADRIGNSIAIGHSAYGAINHDKLLVLDGVLTIAGSTNFSTGGETKQNNEMVLVWDAVFAAETRARIDVIHDQMLQQMAARRGA